MSCCYAVHRCRPYRVLSEHGELRHRSCERGDHVLLVVHVRLPETGRAGVARELAVGLETNLAVQRGHHLALVGAVAW